ncbi:humps family-domain-containing protein [Hyaloraphidium curvatum]|nr:humps family-domain-containing protein [Hyaloraphidium curvatum]
MASTYGSRAKSFKNATAIRLLEIIERKKTNLSVSADVTKKSDLLAIADHLGPYICVLKTHIDILADFDESVVPALADLARRHDFLIFEDRKFADIGNTVKLQYESGIYKIASWADITNAHPLPGEGIVKGLAEAGLPLGRGLLLLAEMSSAGNLIDERYTEETFRMAMRNRDFVIGFIGQRRLGSGSPEEDFLYLTPGVSLASTGDALGQQYRTPRQVLVEAGCDVIIVGRGIYAGAVGNPEELRKRGEEYRNAGWQAYLEKIGLANNL